MRAYCVDGLIFTNEALVETIISFQMDPTTGVVTTGNNLSKQKTGPGLFSAVIAVCAVTVNNASSYLGLGIYLASGYSPSSTISASISVGPIGAGIAFSGNLIYQSFTGLLNIAKIE
jgi:hypothetical protein